MKVLTIGGATQDIFIKYSDPKMLRLYSKKTKQEYIVLKEGSKIELDSIRYYTGGGATNSATSFGRLGFDVSTIFKIGDDHQADLVIQKLKKEGVDTSYVTKSFDLHTGTSIIIPTILVYRGSNTQLTKSDIHEDMIKNCDHLYITSLSGEASKMLPYITDTAKKHAIPVAINPGVSQLAVGAHELRESLKNIDIFILNSDEANEFMLTLLQVDKQLKQLVQKEITNSKQKNGPNLPGLPNLPNLLRSSITYQDICFELQSFFCEIMKLGPKTVVVTNGQEGVYVAHKSQMYFHPSIKTKVVSTLGAGDSFGSCFVASILHGASIEESMLRGVLNSSSVISHLDAKTGLLSKSALEKKAKELTAHIQIFPLNT